MNARGQPHCWSRPHLEPGLVTATFSWTSSSLATPTRQLQLFRRQRLNIVCLLIRHCSTYGPSHILDSTSAVPISRSRAWWIMDLLQKEHDRVWRRLKAGKTINEVQSTIDLLQEARNAIAADPTKASITLAKLQNPVKASFDTTNDSLKEAHSGLNKYTKALEKLFKDRPLPSTEYDALSSSPALVNRAIAMHLLREGQFSVASTFLSEIAQDKTPAQPDYEGSGRSSDEKFQPVFSLDQIQSGEIREQFASMYYILHELKEKSNLLPAIEWARENRSLLEARGSNLEFDLCRLRFVWLFHGGNDPQSPMTTRRQAALDYARQEFSNFMPRHLKEIQQLMGAMAFSPNLQASPYRHIFNNTTAWSDVSQSFTREFCSLLGLSADSPLYIAATAGAIALPTLLKLQTIMKAKRTEWTTQDELPVEIPLPHSYLFHSIFVCPVSKEQTTDQNPPMMMPCGHVIAQESLQRISKGNKFKCPYCPNESHPRDARKVFL
ncbi:RMND5A protein [Talaromyces proteolyticus]|uniref:Protein FYV10 n=1 Tax=Talaromyces proteolyticus TaxID=1131652 RepID=A0AAD4KV47_9EURO|nr:RMND5A protein [Talaromyces proteolyticus]KAH8700554.1 RMND5A protein [Talaromyces proteolyticus]